MWRPVESKTEQKSTKWRGFGLPTRESLAKRHFLLHSTNLYCSIVLCTRPCGKRPLFGHKKSSEKSMYSVPSFGGHIAISRDVTRYPILVIHRTGLFALLDSQGIVVKCTAAIFFRTVD